MKRIVIYLMAMLLVLPATAQSLFSELVKKYVDQEGFSAVQITDDMFDLYLKKKDIKPDDPVYNVLNDLKNMTVITQTYTDDNEKVKDGLVKEIRDYYQNNGYSLFKTEKTAERDLKIYLKKNGENISSMGLLTSNSFSVNLIEMNGKIDLSNVATLNKVLNIRGLEQLQVFDNHSAPDNFYFNYQYRVPKVPNVPGYKLSEEEQAKIREEVQKAQEDMKVHQKEMFIRQKEMGERQKELFEKYQRFPIMITGPNSENADYYVDGKKVTLDELREINPDSVQSIKVIKKDEDKKASSQIRITLKNSK
ncbi:MAG TPA: DUF4252 domain-containing protein [Sunxiuqinia sp.]|nr:DUF4252 domain-containing protein [Sunxiuqinia sp.]